MSKLSRAPFITLLIVLLHHSHGLRILGLFPFQARSHYNMGEKLLKALAMKGHQVDVYNHFPQKNPVPNFTDYSLVGGIHEMKDNVTYETLLEFMEGSSSIRHWMKVAGLPVCDQMSLPVFKNLLRNPPKDPPYDVIISDVVFSSCYIAWSHYLKVPMIEIETTIPYDSLNTHRGNPYNYVTDASIFSESMFPTTFLERLKNYYISITSELAMKWYSREQDTFVKNYFGTGYPSVWDMHKDLALVFINYQHAIQGPRAFVPSIVPIGGMHVEDTNVTVQEDLQTWMDESKDGFIYFSFGSMVRTETLPNYILESLYKAFESIAPVRVLWKVVSPGDLLPNLPKNVKTQKWLPQPQILKHKNIKAFVTHGGLNSMYETIYHGTPTICVPLFADQFTTADLYVKRKMGIKILFSELSTPAFARALNQIIENPRYKQNAIKLSNNLKDLPMSPLDTAIFWVEYVARHGKHALRSPIVDRPWWQFYLLDIYGFIAIVTTLVLFITSKLIIAVLHLVSIIFSYPFSKKIKKN